MSRQRIASWVAPAVLAVISGVPLRADTPEAKIETLFAQRVLPIFKEKCFACHGNDSKDIRGSLDMRSSAGLLRGGDSGEPAVRAGKPQQSSVYLAASRHSDDWSAMPPKESDRLTDRQLQDIRTWIAGGAPWPSEDRLAELARRPKSDWEAAQGIAAPTSRGLSDDWTNRLYEPANLWAYKPLDVPKFDANAGNPVDALLEGRLKELGLEPVPPADRRTLIRRATFDLLGLPPTPDEVEAFINDPETDEAAFAKVVDRLLASPHYGEQWGRHWLDVVRYADSAGYANDFERGNTWRYRDYVVRAFNSDKPYDQFIREQIAGDEIDPDDPEMLVAVGFLRMGPWELTAMEVAKVARQRFLDDVTDAVGQVFLAHMMECARCHDHKFDPVPTRDYYSMQAVFATTQFAERPARFLAEENTAGFEEKKYLQQRMQLYQQQLKSLEEKINVAAARDWFEETQRDPAEFEKAVADLSAKQNVPSEQIEVQKVRNLLATRGVHPDLIPPQHVGFSPEDFGLERVARKGIQRLKWRLRRYEPVAFSVYSGLTPKLRSVTQPLQMPAKPDKTGELEQVCILAGGDPFSPTQPVEPGYLSVISMSSSDQGKMSSEVDARRLSGRRTALVNWIASPDNTLTARVMVNRIWQWHFGRAIAGNPNNFGATGKKPTHPRLLDWLADRFLRNGWSVKSLHRVIMNSHAYRRSTSHPDRELLDHKDPNRETYAVFLPRRLEAEELRDAMLAVSGELNPMLGGIPVRPEMNLEAALQPRQVMGTFAEAWQPSPLPSQRHRRSLYALRLRGQSDPFLEVFNAPAAETSCEARQESTVTPQVFALFNSKHTFTRALALAHRILNETTDRRRALQRAFALVYGRAADDRELTQCLAHWQSMTRRHEELRFEPASYPVEVVREAIEENTGQRFTFTEPLEVYADFVPDLQPCDVVAEVRGLAEVCLVLLNSNEFVFVY